MAEFDPITCEPLRVWSRLEPRTRQVEFDRVLRARVHDALWLLTRQWQFGEFKGEDTGSAVLAKFARTTTPVTAVLAGGTEAEPFDADVPLEARVERLPITFASAQRALLGRHFLLRLDARAGALPGFDRAAYRDAFATVFPLRREVLDPDDPADELALARRRSAGRADRTELALAGRAVDGVALFGALPPGVTAADLPPELALAIDPGHADAVLAALEEYRAWFAGTYETVGADADAAWQPAQLEYRFACALPREDGALVLTADEYASGRLDWHSFDVAALEPDAAAPGLAALDVRTVIPSRVEFPGMPHPRWWQIEDGDVDLGSIRADSTDIAKLVVAEFALLFGNNWLMIPCTQPVGTLGEIGGIVVTDVFGWRTLVRPATGSSGGVWTRWDLFSLATRAGGPGTAPLGQHLWLAPTLVHAGESEPLESVLLARDEMTNSVWAVERRVPDGLGAGRDGAVAGRAFRAALEQLRGIEPDDGTRPPVADAPLRYVLGGTVAEHWIPFVPVHVPGDTRAIRLQRASMPRFNGDMAERIRPRTELLRLGVDADDVQHEPLFVNEEEVPPTGVVVETTYQRARWTDGQTVVWQGRRRRPGAGEASSGLRFDVAEPPRE